MESLHDIELPPSTTKNNVQEDLIKFSCDIDKSEFPVKNNLFNNQTDSPKKISLTITPPSKVVSTPPLCINKISIPTNTDNLLNLNIPKVTVLGKEQAKKRLQAFSAFKQSFSTSPITKKSSKLNSVIDNQLSSEDNKSNAVKLSKKNYKKVLCPEDKARAVIEEIEIIKKAQHADSEDDEMNHLKFKSKSRDKFRNKSKFGKKYKAHHIYKQEPFEYPENWEEFHLRHLTLNSLKQVIHNIQIDKRNSYDYKRHANFEVPASPVSNFKYKGINGEEKSVPYNCIRYTFKCATNIAYSPNVKLNEPKYFTRQHFFSIICKPQQEEISKLINKSSSDRRVKTPLMTQRNWYPKSIFDHQKECEILEHSLGLSILKAYSDEEDDSFNNLQNNKIMYKIENDKQNVADDIDRSYKTYKSHKMKRKKQKKNKKSNNKTKSKDKKMKKSSKKKYSESDSEKEKKGIISMKNNEINVNKENLSREVKFPKCEDVLDDVLNDVKKNTTKIVEVKLIDNRLKLYNEESIHTASDDKIIKQKEVCKSEFEEYNSHWESDDDITPVTSVVNTSDTQDEDWNKRKTVSVTERSLEMPLTLTNFTRRSYGPRFAPEIKKIEIEKTDVLDDYKAIEVQKLNVELKLIEEERKKLEIERKRLAELEKIYKMNILNNENKNICRPLINISDLSVNEDVTSFKIKQEKESDDDDGFNNSSTMPLSTIVNDSIDVINKKEDSLEKDQSILETEYEEFMKAVKSDISRDNIDDDDKKPFKNKRRSYSSSSNSTSSDSEDSTESTSSIQKENSLNFDIQSKDDNLDLPDAQLPVLDKNINLPRPVPVPSFTFNDIPPLRSENTDVDSTTLLYNKSQEELEAEMKKSFTFTKISLPTKKNLLENSAFNDSETSNTSDFADQFSKKDDYKNTETQIENDNCSETSDIKRKRSRSPSKNYQDNYRSKRSKSKESDRRERRKDSPRRRRRDSPRRYKDTSCKRSDYSPRRKKDSSPKHSGTWKRDITPRRNLSPRRRDSSPRRRKVRDRSYSPRNRSPRSRSPKRIRRRDSPSPRRSSSKNRSLSPDRRTNIYNNSPTSRKESIQLTLQRIAGMDDYSNKSPIDSPLGGFKRSLADSTISDDQLLQQHNSYNESPYDCHYFQRTTDSPASPKRLSLDDRINQVLGIEKDQQKGGNQMYHHQDYNYNASYYDQYGQYNQHYEQYNQQLKVNYADYNPVVATGTNKVVQVGNVLQVVPTEDIPPITNAPKEIENVPKIVQVGNMLQIVPTELPQTTMPTSTSDKLSAEALMKQKNAERRAEREKRRDEREKRRKDKEKKRKEKEKRKQLKLKLKTENMIKRALLLETEDNENVQENDEAPAQWPPAPIVISTTSKVIGKGILLSHGFSNSSKSEEEYERKKSVKFADGIIPGEGTSPSGGEELTSPPPATQKLPKEKRFTKTKKPKKISIPKKKKIKVKIVRKPNQVNELDEDDDDDNLPPPSPPPGSPPPHLFPPRIKTHVINNVHSSFQANIPKLPINNSFPSTYRPAISTMPPPHHQPHCGQHHHQPQCMCHVGHHHIPPPCNPVHHPPGPHHPPHHPPGPIGPPHCTPPGHHNPPHHHHHHHHGH